MPHPGASLCCGHVNYQWFGWLRFFSCMLSIAEAMEIFQANGNVIFVAPCLFICLH